MQEVRLQIVMTAVSRIEILWWSFNMQEDALQEQ